MMYGWDLAVCCTTAMPSLEHWLAISPPRTSSWEGVCANQNRLVGICVDTAMNLDSIRLCDTLVAIRHGVA